MPRHRAVARTNGLGGLPLYPSLADWMVYRLGAAAFRLRAAWEAELRRHGLRLPHYTLLAVLVGYNGSQLQNVLAYRAGLSHVMTSRLLGELEGDGLVERSDGHNRRTRRVSLTDPGKKCIDTLQPRLEQTEATFLARIDDGAIEDIHEYVRRLEPPDPYSLSQPAAARGHRAAR